MGSEPRYLYEFPIIDGTVTTQYGDGDVNDGEVGPDGMFSGTLKFEDLCDHGSPTEFETTTTSTTTSTTTTTSSTTSAPTTTTTETTETPG